MRFITTLMAFLLLSLPVIAGEPVRFFQELPDIPLMEGLSEVEEEAYMFDKPEGRIAQASARGDNLTKEAVTLYYRQSLPQFGWNPVKSQPGTFEREGEELHLEIDNTGKAVRLRILIGPNG